MTNIPHPYNIIPMEFFYKNCYLSPSKINNFLWLRAFTLAILCNIKTCTISLNQSETREASGKPLISVRHLLMHKESTQTLSLHTPITRRNSWLIKYLHHPSPLNPEEQFIVSFKFLKVISCITEFLEFLPTIPTHMALSHSMLNPSIQYQQPNIICEEGQKAIIISVKWYSSEFTTSLACGTRGRF